MTDYWSTQTGRIHDILTLDCENGGAITEGSAVEMGTTAANKLVVAAAAGMGEATGIALKAASATTGEVIPVLFHGVYNCTIGGGPGSAVTVSAMILNSVTTTVCASGTVTTAKMMGFGGTSHFLGMALQAGNKGDNILVLVGRSI